MLGFYTRPTIPFKLECEAMNKKQKLISEISENITLLNSLTKDEIDEEPLLNFMLFN